ncbi:copper resistance system multicopper oxidase [Dyella caseinilytica]|uniref:Copper resistance system multicopper oxidase n=1 Tax=Dyella caseinilytica TaxID=1849581 RepID=A0ABX7GY71_9GAMM|nr:copper resistance system multicopper oxidase [Dyella caseinilytica]QRN55436.1 copper resistance system multicopper oxidase [Dyella caseinilytica]GGA01690.1 copper oxidase [Dyella caseinilytica]
MNRFDPLSATHLSRRRFVQGMALGGAVVALGVPRSSRARAMARVNETSSLSGSDFALDIAETAVNYTGKQVVATTVNGSLPGPVLRWKEGSTVRIRVTNRLRVPTSIHWHGIVLPFRMDGVPGISFDGIPAGETFVYQFPVKQSGTYWYHAHSGYQEQTGLFGAILVDPAAGERTHVDRDHVVMLNDWTDDNPGSIFARLKKQSDYYNTAQPTVADLIRDARQVGLSEALRMRRMWNAMRMNPTDLGDVSALTYTYLLNGQAPAGNWTGLFTPGEKVRLRVINGSAMTVFDVRVPGLKMTVVSADGQDVEPVEVDEFRVMPAETYDVIVTPQEDRAYTLFAQSIDRSGYARGTLAPRPGMEADVPTMDRRVWLGMQDMMGSMDVDQHAVHDKHDMAAMQGMSGMADSDMPMHDMPAAASNLKTSPGVDTRTAHPRTSLDDPGVGLRDNGRRVLTYADLHTIGGAIDPRAPERDITLRLTGNMERYMWSFDGVKFSDAEPIRFKMGERLRIVLINDTMMNHPIHLHGMWSELESPDGHFQVRKHTVNVQPAQQISYAVTADNPGRWAYHCHMLFHMEAGMFREVVVA